MEGVHQERAVLRTHGDESLAVAQGELRDGDAPGVRQGLVQERVGLLGRLLGLEVVRRLVIEGTRKLVILNEPGDIDGLARTEWELLKVFVGQLDVVPLLVLIAAHDVAPRDLVVALNAVALVLDPATVLGTEQVERDLARALRRQVQPHRDGDHPEAHHAFPNRSRHAHSPRRPLPLFPARPCRANRNGPVKEALGESRARPTTPS